MMERFPVLAASALIAFACAGFAPAGTDLRTDPPARAEGSDADTCAFEAWVIDGEPKGLNVRAAPSARARITGKLPPMEMDPDLGRKLGAGIKVLQSRNGWFRIGDPEWSRNLGGNPEGPKGWIHGRYIDFALQSDKAFERPDPSSPVVATSWWDYENGQHPFDYRLPRECRGEWVRMLVKGHDGPERLGWVRGTCAIQETTCDGVASDLMSPEGLPRY